MIESTPNESSDIFKYVKGPRKNIETKPLVEEENISKDLKPGDSFTFDGRKFVVERVGDGTELARGFGFNLRRHVPVYFIDGSIVEHAWGAYHNVADVVFMYKGSHDDQSTLRHELVHAIERSQEPTQELLSLFEKAKSVITENSFGHGMVSWNFKKTFMSL